MPVLITRSRVRCNPRAPHAGSPDAETERQLPHWSDVAAPRRERDGVRPSRAMAAQLASLVTWASDLALRLGASADRRPIERVRAYALAWLDGKPCGDPPIGEVCASVEGLLTAIDGCTLGAVRSTGPIAAQLADLVAWAADLAVHFTHDCPEDREAIDKVRRYVMAWLAGESCRDLAVQDVLTTVATLLAAIDLDVVRNRAAAALVAA